MVSKVEEEKGGRRTEEEEEEGEGKEENEEDRGGDTRVEVRGQLVEVSFLLPPCWFWESGSGHQTWWQALLPTKSPNWPTVRHLRQLRSKYLDKCRVKWHLNTLLAIARLDLEDIMVSETSQ